MQNIPYRNWLARTLALPIVLDTPDFFMEGERPREPMRLQSALPNGAVILRRPAGLTKV